MFKIKPASVNLKRKIKIGSTWTFVPVAKKNGRYVADQVLINGVATKVTEGTFYIEWRENGKRVQKSVGQNGQEAISAQKSQTNIHALRCEGMTIEDNAPQISTGRETLDTVIDTYLDDKRVTLRPKTLEKYGETLKAFEKFTTKQHLEDLRPDDIREYMNYLTESENLQARTVKVKGRIVHGVFTGLGASLPMKKGDWPKVTKKSGRPMYRTSTIKSLLATVSREHYILWSFFLHTGFREQEVAFCAWEDIDWERGEISVREKKHLEFEIKNYERRTVPVVTELMELLREHRQTLPQDAYLIFPTRPAKGSAGKIKKGGKNRLNMLDLLKLDYFRAGLNCGTCKVVCRGEETQCALVPQCFRAGLHMFRHTYGTNLLRAGFTLTDVAKLLGHQDTATTHLYLHSLENEDLREQVLQSNLGTMYTPDAFKPVEHKRIHIVTEEARKRMSEGGKRSAQVKAMIAAQ